MQEFKIARAIYLDVIKKLSPNFLFGQKEGGSAKQAFHGVTEDMGQPWQVSYLHCTPCTRR